MRRLLIISILLYIGCNRNGDDSNICDTPIVGEYNVETNYPNWKNSSCKFGVSNANTINLGFSSLDQFCNLDEIVISGLPKTIGNHSIILHNLKFVKLSDFTAEDGLLGWYQLDTNFVNKINFQSISDDGLEISGTFNLQFVPDPFLPPKFQDTIYFRNGTFTAKLVK